MYCIFEYISFDFEHMADFRIQGSQSKINIFFNCRLFSSAARSSSLCIEFEFRVSNCQTYITFDFCSSIRVLVRVTQVFSLADFDFWGLILVEYSSAKSLLWIHSTFLLTCKQEMPVNTFITNKFIFLQNVRITYTSIHSRHL